MMLRHIGLISYADKIENALLYTLEHGVHTGDFGEKGSASVKTDEFADAVAANLGKTPSESSPVHTSALDFEFAPPIKPDNIRIMKTESKVQEKLVGMDIFISSADYPGQIAEQIKNLLTGNIELTVISNRGTQVWPTASVFTDSVAHYCCRLETKAEMTRIDLLELCKTLSFKLKIENIEFLKEWGELKGYSLAQGQ
jgi:isocitrate dehydrogenase